MKIDIEWELTEEIGVEFLKESYITLREQVELDKKQVELDKALLQSFHDVFYYLMVMEKADEFISEQEKAYD
jgi:hypothetical protein